MRNLRYEVQELNTGRFMAAGFTHRIVSIDDTTGRQTLDLVAHCPSQAQAELVAEALNSYLDAPVVDKAVPAAA